MFTILADRPEFTHEPNHTYRRIVETTLATGKINMFQTFKIAGLFLATALMGIANILSKYILTTTSTNAEAKYVASQEKRTTQETLHDQYITSSIKAKLLADSNIPGMDINMNTFLGDVTLQNTLQSQQAIDRAIEIAHDTNNMRSIASKLILVD